MKRELKILMMGGKRVGKTSALAAIVESFSKPPVNTLLKADDITVLDEGGNEERSPLKKKIKEIKKTLNSSNGRIILAETGKTQKVSHFRLRFSVPDKFFGRIEITFTDVNGEFYEAGGKHHDESLLRMKDYDAFIVAVDTPMLMESATLNNAWVNDAVNDSYNCVSDIDSFLSQVGPQNEKDIPKLVIFTPIKCEKWAKEDKLDDVVKRIDDIYFASIGKLKAYPNIQVEFLPIQRIGSMVFYEHLPASLFEWSETFMLFFNRNRIQECSVTNDGRKVRLSDGSEKDVSDGQLKDDPNCVLIDGTDIVRPNAWYKVTDCLYMPHNCDQLAMHILHFMCKRIIDARSKANLFKKTIDSIKVAFQDFFSSISTNDLKNLIERMEQQQLIHTTGEGIEISQKVNFYK